MTGKPLLRRPCVLRRGPRRRLFSRSPNRGLGSRPPQDEGSGAPKGAVTIPRLRARHAPYDRCVSPPGAPPRQACAVWAYLRRFPSPGPYFRARIGGIPPTLIQAAFAAFPPHRVQPLKAVPRSGDGRLPEASRTNACEAFAQAPHPVPPSRRLMMAPLSEPSARRIRQVFRAGITFFRP